MSATTSRRVVRSRLRFELLPQTPLTDTSPPPPIPVRVALRWISTDPHAIAVRIATGRRLWVPWLIGRDLLAAGLNGPAGLGDVMVLPDLDDAGSRVLVLTSPSGCACLRFAAADVAAFLARTHLPTPTSAAAVMEVTR